MERLTGRHIAARLLGFELQALPGQVCVPNPEPCQPRFWATDGS
jgi:hypothetical protein